MLNINFDQLHEQMKEVLDFHDIPNEPSGIDAILGEWYSQKRPLLELFSKHPNWDNDCLSVLFETTADRRINTALAVRTAINILIRARDETLFAQDPEADSDRYLSLVKMQRSTDWYFLLDSSTVTERNAKDWQHLYDKIRVGQRTSRCCRKVFAKFGADQYEGFDHDYAQLADTVSPLSITRFTALSLHPCDYLLMSHGTGWQSCHRISGGEWQAGTWSYMLDDLSAILYTVDASYDNSDKRIWNEEKINRMVCCFKDNQIMFSRLYPQNQVNDYALRQTFRNTVQKIYADCRNVPNLWQKPMECPNEYVLTASNSTHYEDYEYYDFNAELSILKGAEPERMYIGSMGMCPTCGNRYKNAGIMCCEDCDDSTYCVHCGRHIANGETRYELPNGGFICQHCYDYDYFTCDECGEVHNNLDRYTDFNSTVELCPDCADRILYTCESCGETFVEGDVVYDLEDHCWYCDECHEELVQEREAEDDAAIGL